MKRSEFKELVKECLMEILRDNMDIFQESSFSRSAPKVMTKESVKRSLMNLVNEGPQQRKPNPRVMIRQRPQQPRQQPQQKQKSGPPSPLDMILSAKETMNQQNAAGEMSSRSISLPSAQGMISQQLMEENYNDLSAYGGQVPVDMGMIPGMSQGGFDGVDGDSHWAQLAFFDK